jgi:hypothetical protein
LIAVGRARTCEDEALYPGVARRHQHVESVPFYVRCVAWQWGPLWTATGIRAQPGAKA